MADYPIGLGLNKCESRAEALLSHCRQPLRQTAIPYKWKTLRERLFPLFLAQQVGTGKTRQQKRSAACGNVALVVGLLQVRDERP